jgi:hypothetical protein
MGRVGTPTFCQQHKLARPWEQGWGMYVVTKAYPALPCLPQKYYTCPHRVHMYLSHVTYLSRSSGRLSDTDQIPSGRTTPHPPSPYTHFLLPLPNSEFASALTLVQVSQLISMRRVAPKEWAILELSGRLWGRETAARGAAGKNDGLCTVWMRIRATHDSLDRIQQFLAFSWALFNGKDGKLL